MQDPQPAGGSTEILQRRLWGGIDVEIAIMNYAIQCFQKARTIWCERWLQALPRSWSEILARTAEYITAVFEGRSRFNRNYIGELRSSLSDVLRLSSWWALCNGRRAFSASGQHRYGLWWPKMKRREGECWENAVYRVESLPWVEGPRHFCEGVNYKFSHLTHIL